LLSPQRLAESIAETTFVTIIPQDEIDSYASIFGYQDGTAVQHEIIEYLNERSENEVTWLETLGKSDIPTTLIWGVLDAIAPLAVPDHIWENYLADRETAASYWRIPCANHYLQVDMPDLVASIIHASLAQQEVSVEMTGMLCQAVKIH
jgi:pimeloyl-ACP methyl ester carboxylesterase